MAPITNTPCSKMNTHRKELLMSKFKTIADLADEYVKQNNIKNKSIQFQIWCNFESAWIDKLASKYKPSQVIAIEFDRVFIDNGGQDLIEIEL